MKRGGAALFLLAGVSLLAQEWNLEALKERTQSKEARLEAMREQVFLRYGPELGYERADEVPIMDREYEQLRERIKKLEAQLDEQKARDDQQESIARQEAQLAEALAAQAALEKARQEARAKKEAIARSRAQEEAHRLAELEAPFREALGYYRQKQYSEAYDRFIKLYFERDDSVPVGFYTGRSAFETRRYEIASGAYQQVLSLDPDHRRARLELARTYYVMGRHQEARLEFEQVAKEGDLPPAVAENIQAYLESIESMQKRHHLSGQLIAGLGYDSNVNQGNDYLPQWLEAFTSDPVNPAQSDLFFNLMSANTHRYDFGLPGGWQLKTDLLLLANQYSDVSENNLHLIGLQTGPMADLYFGRILLPVGYDHVRVDQSALMDQLIFNPQYQLPIGRNQTIQVGAKWLDRQNAEASQSDRDATGIELSVNWQRLGGREDRLFSAGLLYAQEAPKSGSRPDAEFIAIALQTGYSWLHEKWSAGVNLRYKLTDFPIPFEDVEPVDRSDNQLGLSLNFSRNLREGHTLSSQLSWLDNSSTYAPYDYDKTTLQLNYGWSWGI
jgi:TolA-binding protein